MFGFIKTLFGKSQPAMTSADQQPAADRQSSHLAASSNDPQQVIDDEELVNQLSLVTYIDILRERGYTLSEGNISLLALPAERALNQLMGAGLTAQQAQHRVDEWVSQRKLGPGGQNTSDKVLMTLIGSKIGIGLRDWRSTEASGAAQKIDLPEKIGLEIPTPEQEANVLQGAAVETSIPKRKAPRKIAMKTTGSKAKKKAARTKTVAASVRTKKQSRGVTAKKTVAQRKT